jgi:hypothetical protein
MSFISNGKIMIADSRCMCKSITGVWLTIRMLLTLSVGGKIDDPEKDPEEVVRAKLDGPCVTLDAFLKLEDEATGESRFRAELFSN